VVQPLYQNDAIFRVFLESIFTQLTLPHAGVLPAQLHLWGARDFDNDYQNQAYVNLLTTLHTHLEVDGLLTQLGIVTPIHTPDCAHQHRGPPAVAP